MSETMTDNELSSPTSTSSSDDFSPRKMDKACYKKSNKPMMEKKRRARINSCLSQLKSLVLQAMKKDNSQYSKLEKADILELTVRHFKNVQRYQANSAMAQLPDAISKYRAGFNECANEVVRYLAESQGVNDEARTRILSHLASLLSPINGLPLQQTQVPMSATQLQQVQHQLQQQQQQQQQQSFLQQLHLQQQQQQTQQVLFASASQQLAVDTNNNKSTMPHPAFLVPNGSNLEIGHAISGSPTAFQSPIMAGSNNLTSLQFPYVTTTGVAESATTQIQLVPTTLPSGHVALVLAPQNIPAMTVFGTQPQNGKETITNHPLGVVSSLGDCKTRVAVSDSSVPLRKKRAERLGGGGLASLETRQVSSMTSLQSIALNLKRTDTPVTSSTSSSSGVISRGYNSQNSSQNSSNSHANLYALNVVRTTSTWRPW